MNGHQEAGLLGVFNQFLVGEAAVLFDRLPEALAPDHTLDIAVLE